MEKQSSVPLDTCEFLRRRALALLDEGEPRLAARLLRAVDRTQAELVRRQTPHGPYSAAN